MGDVFVNMMALFWNSSIIPSVRCHINGLCFICFESQRVPCAGRTTRLPLAWVLSLRLIVKLQKLLRCPRVRVKVEPRRLESIFVSVDVREKYSIIRFDIASLLFTRLVPKIT